MIENIKKVILYDDLIVILVKRYNSLLKILLYERFYKLTPNFLIAKN